MVISADVIEHIPNPDDYMRTLRRFCAQYYVISTPDRAAYHGGGGAFMDEPLPNAFTLHLTAGGPPFNAVHVREWTHNELAAYATQSGFVVLDVRKRADKVRPWQNTMWMLLELKSTATCRE